MKKFSFRLPSGLYSELKKAAAARGTSMSEVARQALAKEVVEENFKALVDRIETKLKTARTSPFHEIAPRRPAYRRLLTSTPSGRVRERDADWERHLDEMWA